MKVEIAQPQYVNAEEIISRSKVAHVPGADQTLTHCLSISCHWWAGMIDGQAACVFGLVAPCILSNEAYLWLLTTDLAEAHPFLLVRYSQMMLKEMLAKFPKITGHCELSDARARRWVRWLGGKFGYPTDQRIPFEIHQWTR